MSAEKIKASSAKAGQPIALTIKVETVQTATPSLFSGLSQRETAMVLLRHGYRGCRPLTLPEAAEFLSLSLEVAGDAETRGFRKTIENFHRLNPI